MMESFICYVCKEQFDKVWSEQKAEDEYKHNFPGAKVDEREVVCDVCYHKLIKIKPIH
jgi:hypothetical protein